MNAEERASAARAAGERIADIYRGIFSRAMSNVAICNDRLAVEAVDFQPFGALALGIVVTPWFMNVTLAPCCDGALPPALPGAATPVALPAGQVDFTAGELDGFGPLWTCSLFSPMDEFADHAGARATAAAALEALTAPPPAASPSGRPPIDRRALLRGGGAVGSKAT